MTLQDYVAFEAKCTNVKANQKLPSKSKLLHIAEFKKARFLRAESNSKAFRLVRANYIYYFITIMILLVLKTAAITSSPTTMLWNFSMPFRSRLHIRVYLHLKCLHRLSNKVTSGQLGMSQVNVYQAHIHFNDGKSTESEFLLGNIAS